MNARLLIILFCFSPVFLFAQEEDSLTTKPVATEELKTGVQPDEKKGSMELDEEKRDEKAIEEAIKKNETKKQAEEQKENPNNSGKVLWGDDYKLGSKTSLGNILGHDSTSFYILKFIGAGENMTTNLEEYGLKTLHLANTYTIPLVFPGEDIRVEASWLLDDFIWIFTSYYNKKVDTLYSYSQQFDLKGKKRGDRILIEKIPLSTKRLVGEFDYVLSVDSNNVLAVYSPPVDKYTHEIISYRMISKNNKILWKEDVELSHASEYFQRLKRIVPDSGHIYILAATFTNKVNAANKNRVKNTGKYSLFNYNHSNRTLNEAQLALNGKYITSVTMQYDNKKNLYVIGLFSRTRSYSVSGAFYLKLDMKEGNVVEKGFSDFDQDFLRKFISDKRVRNDKELDSFEIKELFADSIGQITLIAEQYYINTTTYTDPRTGHIIYTYYYNYNDILILNFNKDGRIKTGARLAKQQQSLDDRGYFSSYAAVARKDKLYIVYNDNPKNLDIPPNGRDHFVSEMDDPNKSVAVYVSYTNGLAGDKNVLFYAKEADYIFNPNIIYRIDEDTIILFAQGWKNYRFVKVDM